MSILTLLSLLSILIPLLEWLIQHGQTPGPIQKALIRRTLARIRVAEPQMTSEQKTRFESKIERFRQLAGQVGIIDE